MQRRRNVNFDKMVHLNSKTKRKTKQKTAQLDKKNNKFAPTGSDKKRKKTMSDMSSIQKWSHLVFQDVLGLR